MKVLENPNIAYKVHNPLRIRVKDIIFKALQNIQVDLPSVYQFELAQDNIGFLQSFDWKDYQRLVVLYLLSVEASKDETEQANFLIFCAVCPSENDDTIAFQSLNFLADQVRCCLWGCGEGIGFRHLLKDILDIRDHSPFNFKIDLETRLGSERVVIHGIIEFNITYAIKECCSLKEIYRSGIETRRVQK